MTRARRQRAQKRRRAGKPPIYAVERVEEIARAAAEEMIGDIIRLAAYTGLRQGELLALRWRNLDFTSQSITVARRYVPGDGEDLPKGNEERTVPMSDQAAAVLDRLSRRDSFTRPGDLVFPDDVGSWRNPGVVRSEYVKARDSVIVRSASDGDELPAIRFHGLRHSFGSQCAAAGVPLVTIKAWMGHQKIETTEVYLHFAPQADDAARLTAAFEAVSRTVVAHR